jgi:hypothetical protein
MRNWGEAEANPTQADEFIAIHYTGDEMKGLRWVGHVARMGERRNTYGVLVGNYRKETTLKT